MTLDLSHQLFWIIVEAAVATATGLGFLIDHLQKRRLMRHARPTISHGRQHTETAKSHTL